MLNCQETFFTKWIPGQWKKIKEFFCPDKNVVRSNQKLSRTSLGNFSAFAGRSTSHFEKCCHHSEISRGFKGCSEEFVPSQTLRKTQYFKVTNLPKNDQNIYNWFNQLNPTLLHSIIVRSVCLWSNRWIPHTRVLLANSDEFRGWHGVGDFLWSIEMSVPEDLRFFAYV